MDTGPLRSVTPTIDIYIKLAQYPVLSDAIRMRMRQELFRRDIVSQADFEREVKELAKESQRREGLSEPYSQEEESIWQKRKKRIRDFHTDAYFANNLGSSVLEQIIEEVLSRQPAATDSAELNFNPEIAPWELLFRQGEIYEAMPQPEREAVSHHLEELKVVLIKRMISDHLPFIGVARKVFSIADLRWVYRRMLGAGKIGGKAANMVLAWRILQQTDPEFGPDISQAIAIPDSHFIGSEIIYEFNVKNKLDDFINQKYRPEAEMRVQFPRIVAAHLAGEFPEYIVDQLERYLAQLDGSPLMVRSSSLLEDSFNPSFSGRYSSYFCPNQGAEAENLKALLDAVRRVYASTFNPEAMMDRRKYGLIDYDERMAVLIQELQGARYGRYFLPPVAGVGYSYNPSPWNADIRPEDGCLHLVWGFGTQAVGQLKHEQGREIALTQPERRQETTLDAIRQSSQRFVDVVELDNDRLQTLPVAEVLGPDYPYLPYVASIDRGDHLEEIGPDHTPDESDELLLTFDYLTRDRKFVKLMRTALGRLENVYETPVEIEFALEILPGYPDPDYRLCVLQCRPFRQGEEDGTAVRHATS